MTARSSRRRGGAAALAAAALLLAGCGSSSTGDAGGSRGASPGPSARLTGTVTVFAAASLQEAFTSLAHRFETAHPGSRVVLGFGPSSGLAQQILAGAPADVFAAASAKNMGQVVTGGTAASPTTFVRNVMEIAVPPANPARVGGLRDLAARRVKVALCQPQVPCGATAAKVFTNANLRVTPVTAEVDVKSVLAKVTLGEVDAGVVYVTDVRAAGDKVRGIVIPPAVNASTSYPIAVLKRSANRAIARAFVDFVLSPAGAAVLAAAGFARP